MPFGRRRRQRVQAAVREAMGEFATATESRYNAEIERRRQLDLAVIEAVRAMRSEFAQRDRELASVLETLARTIDQTGRRLEIDAAERRTLVEAVLELARPEELPPAPRVIGGSIGPGRSVDLTGIPD